VELQQAPKGRNNGAVDSSGGKKKKNKGNASSDPVKGGLGKNQRLKSKEKIRGGLSWFDEKAGKSVFLGVRAIFFAEREQSEKKKD